MSERIRHEMCGQDSEQLSSGSDGFPFLNCDNDLTIKQESEMSHEEEESSTGRSPGERETYPVKIEDEGETYSMDIQDCERRKRIINLKDRQKGEISTNWAYQENMSM